MNRRDMLSGLCGIIPVLSAGIAAASEPNNIKMESIELKCTATRELRDISDLDTDFLEARAGDERVPYLELAVVLDGKIVEQATYANCITGEVHYFDCTKEERSRYQKFCTPLMHCEYGKVQIFYAKPEYRYISTPDQIKPWPHATFDSPERKLVHEHYSNR